MSNLKKNLTSPLIIITPNAHITLLMSTPTLTDWLIGTCQKTFAFAIYGKCLR